MSNPTLFLVATFLFITPPAHSLCSHSTITSLSLNGFTHFAHALHSHNLSTASRLTCFVVAGSALLGRPVSPDTIKAHIHLISALPYYSLLRLPPKTTLPTLHRKNTLIFSTDGTRVSFNNIPITAPNLHVDDSCVVHGVAGLLLDGGHVVPRTKVNVTSQRRRIVEVVRFIRRSHGPVVADHDHKKNKDTMHP